MSKIQLIHDQDYAKATATGIVVVDFRMDFCPGCERMDAVLTHLAQLPENHAIRFVALSINQDFRVAEAIGVKSAPTVLVKQNGQIIGHFFGAQPASRVQALLDHAQQEVAANV
ncbi:thioredoxin family protein [Lacticaseibacillus sp. N501-2]|uniref:thioredoxin family protein n=1 Tax=Lacticaseibacillus salsurae TaxID=3367729 RepID=UPI0038B337D5